MFNECGYQPDVHRRVDELERSSLAVPRAMQRGGFRIQQPGSNNYYAPR
jgi:hypothetical protein